MSKAPRSLSSPRMLVTKGWAETRSTGSSSRIMGTISGFMILDTVLKIFCW